MELVCRQIHQLIIWTFVTLCPVHANFVTGGTVIVPDSCDVVSLY